MFRAAGVILGCSSALIFCGGLNDGVAPRRAADFLAWCGQNKAAQEELGALLCASGGRLGAIAIAVGALANGNLRRGPSWALALILVLVLPSEVLNAPGMRRAASRYYPPLAFLALGGGRSCDGRKASMSRVERAGQACPEGDGL